MKMTGIDILDGTVQRTNLWLKDLMQEMNWNDRRRAFLAFRSVLHAVRDYLPAAQVIAFGDQLPMLVRGFYIEKWNALNPPVAWRSEEEFVSRLREHLSRNGEDPGEAEVILRAVFRMLDRKAAEGEIDDLRSVFPPEFAHFFPPALRAA